MNWEPVVDRICRELAHGEPSREINTEESFERVFVEPRVRAAISEVAPTLTIATHPWIKPDTPRPLPPEIRQRSRDWAACKEWAAVDGWGMKHTLDMAIRDPESLESVAVEVKFCKVKGRRLPNGEFQRMVGQALLGRKKHQQVIAVFGYRADTEFRDDGGLTEFLRGHGVWLVVTRVP
jgi:hypothetical protein